MGISDCTAESYVDELKNIRNSGTEDSDIISAIYKALDNLCRSSIAEEIHQGLKSQFEDQALIYVASNEGPSWRKTSQCVWSTAAHLRNMVSLNNDYEEMEDFFVKVIGVRPVTLDMAIDELKQAGSRQPVIVEEVKACLLAVNSLLSSEPDQGQRKHFEKRQKQRQDLEKRNIFPVRYPTGEVQCVSADTEFFLVDREFLQLQFEGRVKFLDFSLEETVRLRHFIEWAQLEDRSISLRVRKVTSVQEAGAQPMPQLDRHFQQRAHALSRYAWLHMKHRESLLNSFTELLNILRAPGRQMQQI